MGAAYVGVAFHAYGMAAFTRILGMDPEEANEICAQASKAVDRKSVV